MRRPNGITRATIITTITDNNLSLQTSTGGVVGGGDISRLSRKLPRPRLDYSDDALTNVANRLSRRHYRERARLIETGEMSRGRSSADRSDGIKEDVCVRRISKEEGGKGIL